MKKIEQAARWGMNWQKSGDWEHHTVDKERASKLVCGYVRFIKVFAKKNIDCEPDLSCLDIGAGAGYISSALSKYTNINVTASEWNSDGVMLIRKHNPNLDACLIDILNFNEHDKWDLIVCRELYPFTRVNSFTEQYEIVSRIITSLKPGGVFLMIGSDISFPHCMDYDLLCKTIKKDSRLSYVSQPYLEAILLRISIIKYTNRTFYWVANKLGEIVFKIMARRGWAPIRSIVFKKTV